MSTNEEDEEGEAMSYMIPEEKASSPNIYLVYYDFDHLRDVIQGCSDEDHVQQVAFSTYHDSLTQICFSCGTVRTEIREEEVEK